MGDTTVITTGIRVITLNSAVFRLDRNICQH